MGNQFGRNIKLVVRLLLFLPLVVPTNAYSFNKKRCNDEIVYGVGSGAGMGLGAIMGSMESSSSYVSSTGPCRAIGERESERLNFVVVNHDALEKDAARGSGENLATLASLYDIPKPQSSDFGKYIQQNFKAIFGDAANKDPEQVFDDLENKVARFKTGITL